ncbi:hypothetical protein JY651_44105 [Pyxidicoccus parkwayensis]|jgi:hypothetical protein|uniref:Uncharacterized protein n=1 Tax=Pyxidicoccus parkwayensis TaxID=2813578 RepID=A0ABX7NXD0_9BACT|nr:hypothetical protein [Pyxidicoccus parkwaysis]QSQ22054.1 hypothetical protein JY651_44105 [Pyxidicoccus parkwaysis]
MSHAISDEELREIRARVAATTRGPWTAYVEGWNHTSGSSFIMRGVGKARGEDLEST